MCERVRSSAAVYIVNCEFGPCGLEWQGLDLGVCEVLWQFFFLCVTAVCRLPKWIAEAEDSRGRR